MASKFSRRSFIKATLATAAVGTTAGVALSGLPAHADSAITTASVEDPFASQSITLNVNGKDLKTTVEPRAMLVNVLRENLGLVGTKRPCNRMECGGCTVVINGRAYYSCTYLATRAEGKKILTVEGRDVDPVIKAVQDAWVPNDASQCGYCQPGRIMAATALLKSNPKPTVDEIKRGLEGVLCRCGTYVNVLEAMQQAVKNLGGAS